jgi:hypothetical protein
MATQSNLSNIRDEVEAETTWRTYSRHVIAHLLEGCTKCGTLREKEHLTRCRSCEDDYLCKNGRCSQQHNTDMHPAVASRLGESIMRTGRSQSPSISNYLFYRHFR